MCLELIFSSDVCSFYGSMTSPSDKNTFLYFCTLYFLLLYRTMRTMADALKSTVKDTFGVIGVLISLWLKENSLMCLYDNTWEQLIKNKHENMISERCEKDKLIYCFKFVRTLEGPTIPSFFGTVDLNAHLLNMTYRNICYYAMTVQHKGEHR